MGVDLIKVIFLGAPGVGKTSVIQQFVRTEFSDECRPTTRKYTYFPSVIVNDRLYDLKVTDLPAIPYFPVDSFQEWKDYRFFGLRNATAYILVFDVSNVDTFQYIRTLREQIAESRDIKAVPLIVVGNKQDLVVLRTADADSWNVSGSSHGPSGVLAVASTSGAANSVEKRKDIQSLVKKHWKCGYVECSARYNWRVVAVFRELMMTVAAMDALPASMGYKEVCSPVIHNINNALDKNRCQIL